MRTHFAENPVIIIIIVAIVERIGGIVVRTIKQI